MTFDTYNHFHNAVILGKRGSQIYVVDEDGTELSSGHFRVKWNGGDKFVGYNATSEETFGINTDEINPWGRLTRKMTLEDVVEHAADERVATFAAYLKKYDSVPDDERVEMGKINL